MIKIYATVLSTCLAMIGYGQSLDSLMKSVEQNNPSLVALNKWLQAEETRARTGIYPDNPTVTYNYLWGSQSAFGDQKELEIIQTFRYPGYYTSRSDYQQMQYEQRAVWVEKQRQEVMHQVRSAFFNLAWIEKRESLIQLRLSESERLVSIMQAGFERGEVSQPAYDRARILHINLKNEWQRIISEKQTEERQLQQLNGGITLPNLIYEYPENMNIPEQDSLVIQLKKYNPDLQLAQYRIDQSEEKIRLEKMNKLPLFEAGYHSENILNQQLKGIHAGLSIPLWENKNQVNLAKLENEWRISGYQQVESELTTEILSLYNTLETCYRNYLEMKEILDSEQVTGSSLELLQAGQISFPEYLVEIQFIMDNQNKFLETEKECYILRSELMLKTGE